MKNSGLFSVYRRIFKYTDKAYLPLLLFCCAVVGNTAALAAPTYIGAAMDNIKAAGEVDFKAVLEVLPILGGLYLTAVIMALITGVLSTLFANNIVYNLRKAGFDKLSRMPIKYIDGNSHGDIISRFVNDADSVNDGVQQLCTQFFTAVVTVCAALFFMFRLSPIVTLAVICVTPLTFLVGAAVTKASNRSFADNQRLLGEISGFTEEHIGGMKVIKAFASEDSMIAEFEEINSRLYSVGQRSQFLSSLTNPSTRFVNHLSYILVGFAGGLLAIHSGLSVGAVAGFLTYSAMFAKPFNEFTAITTQLMSACAAARRIFALIDEEEQSDDSSLAQLERIRGDVSFKNVAFSYTPERPLIRNFNLSVKAGSKVAIIGPTGAGKSTLINLLMRFYDVTDGVIEIDGVDITTVTRTSLRRNFAMVLQDTWLFSGTISDNIAYGADNVSREDIVKAAKEAHAHSFISMLPNGYDTVIGEDAANLSQGQKQLLTIARAMLCDPPILILDEATSSVDSLTEQKIQRGFMKIMKGRTSFVIAHRLSTVQDADVILVMKDGGVIEQGSHEELLKMGGFYHDLYYSQFAGRSEENI